MLRRVALLGLAGALACASPQGGTTTAVQHGEAAAAVTPADSSPMRPLHLARVTERTPTSFPHSPHLHFECTRCHTQLPGHERHARQGCRDCHEAPAASDAQPATTECRSCHHARTQAYGCLHCHDGNGAPAAVRTVTVRVRLAGTATTRKVAFPHTRHAQLPCSRCHGPDHDAQVGDACASCHSAHHQAQAECSACHTQPRAGAHDVGVHQGCGGSACHTNTAVLALPQSRTVCLVCHRDRVAHEPQGDCELCHNLRARRPATEAGQ